MGDPQAPFAKVLALLDRFGLLGPQGFLRSEVQLVSMGDHFDWGKPVDRPLATRDGIALLSWLVSHPKEQVIILAGNHDLARVCELHPFSSDESFEVAYRLAKASYTPGQDDDETSKQFVAQYPHLPNPESLARDFSCYSSEQQRLVTEVLRTQRFRLAHAHRGLLLTHAGVTQDDFALLGEQPTDAASAALGLNAFFDARVAQWSLPLNLSPLHRPGSSTGAGAGVLYHRPASPQVQGPFASPPRRRFDPRTLPAAFPQAIGHIRDQKCHELLGDWATDASAIDGPIRALSIDGESVSYARGSLQNSRLYFLDGGMLQALSDRYELFDLDRRAPLAPLL